MQPSKKTGRPKTPENKKASISINVYLTQDDHLEIKRCAKKLHYKSLSRLAKDTLLATAREKENNKRYVDPEHEAYKSYASVMDQQIDDIYIILENSPVSEELIQSLDYLDKVLQQFITRLQPQ